MGKGKNRFGKKKSREKSTTPQVIGADGAPITSQEPDDGEVCEQLSQPVFMPTPEGPFITLAKIACVREKCNKWDTDAPDDADPRDGCLLRQAAEAAILAQEDTEALVRAAAHAGHLELEDEDDEPVDLPAVEDEPTAEEAELDAAAERAGDPLERDTVELPKVDDADAPPASPIALVDADGNPLEA